MTPEEDREQELTPADLRRRRRSGTIVFSLFMTVVVIGLVTTVLAVNDGRNYRRLAIRFGLEHYLLPAIAPPDIRIDRLTQRAVGESYPPWLVASRLERTAHFDNAPQASAEERCRHLQGETGAEPQFTALKPGWECTLLQEFGIAAAQPSSIFLQAKGADGTSVASLRIKLNLTDPATERVATNEAIAALQRFSLPFSPETQSYLREMLAGRRPFSSLAENYRITFEPEMMDPRRYNLVVLPRPQTIGCGEKPEQAAEPNDDLRSRMPIACRPMRGASQEPEL